jgi:hypothetical protein
VAAGREKSARPAGHKSSGGSDLGQARRRRQPSRDKSFFAPLRASTALLGGLQVETAASKLAAEVEVGDRHVSAKCTQPVSRSLSLQHGDGWSPIACAF